VDDSDLLRPREPLRDKTMPPLRTCVLLGVVFFQLGGFFAMLSVEPPARSIIAFVVSLVSFAALLAWKRIWGDKPSRG
jgi:hypothetical protein